MSANGFNVVQRALESFLFGNRDDGTERLLQHCDKVARFQVFTYNLPAQDKDDLVQFMFVKKILMKEAKLREIIEAADLREEGLVQATVFLRDSLRYVPLEYLRSERRHHHDPLEASQTEFEAIETFRDGEARRNLRSLIDAVRAQLSEKDQQTFDAVLVPRIVQGFSSEELGETLGEKPNLLRCRVSRLLPKLRKRLLEMT
jgi:DNA-directed RNA polymerase specialized sigma24 family protein